MDLVPSWIEDCRVWLPLIPQGVPLREWSSIMVMGGGGGLQYVREEASEVLPLPKWGQKKYQPC